MVALEALHAEREADMLDVLLAALRRHGAPDAIYPHRRRRIDFGRPKNLPITRAAATQVPRPAGSHSGTADIVQGRASLTVGGRSSQFLTSSAR